MSEWRKIDEELPDLWTPVCLWSRHLGLQVGDLSFDRDGGDVFCVRGLDETVQKGDYGYPTHWIPLPEPPDA